MAAVVTSTKGGVMARRLRKSRRAVVRPTPVPPARPRSGVQQPEIGGSSRNRRLAALLAGVFATGLGLIGAGRPTIWYDEAVTLNLLHRPFERHLAGAPRGRRGARHLLRGAAGVDLVHG